MRDDKNDNQDEPQLYDTPQKHDESSIGGSVSKPNSDDNVLDAAHEVGLYEDADEEHPKELNIAEEIEKDEKDLREG